MKRGLVIRVILTVIVFIAFGLINELINVISPIVTGNLAVQQLEDSNVASVYSQIGMRYLIGNPLSGIVLLIALIAIWFGAIKKLFAGNKGATTVAILLIATIMATPAWSFYDRKDRTEFVEIGPNQSAFLIPLTGANKAGQGKFMSIDYLQANKVATKRIQIPHVLMHMPGLEWDMYIPSAKLIIVDRTPYQREWTNNTKTGTSAKVEGFKFESNESIGMSTSLMAAAAVTEEDVAKFLYWFGVKNVTKTDDPYPSVAYGYSLYDVMDSYVRGMVQTVLAREMGALPVSDIIKTKKKIILTVFNEVKTAFEKEGITIKYIGYADQLNFDDAEIQKMINNVFIAKMNAERVPYLQKTLPLQNQEADIAIKNGFALSASKWNGNIPSFLILPEKLWDTITGWFSSSHKKGQ